MTQRVTPCDAPRGAGFPATSASKGRTLRDPAVRAETTLGRRRNAMAWLSGLVLFFALATEQAGGGPPPADNIKAPPQNDPHGYISLDLSKGGVQSDTADLKLRAKILIGGRIVDMAHLPAGLKYFAELGVIAPEWLDIRPLHRFPLPPLKGFQPPPGMALD